MPNRLLDLGMAVAEAEGQTISSLLEDLLRRHLEEKGIPVGVPIDELMKMLVQRFGITAKKTGRKTTSAEL